MTITDGNLASADDVMNLVGKQFKIQAQLLFNASLIGWDSDLDSELENLKYSAIPSGGTGDIVDAPIFGANVLDDFEDGSIDANIWTTATSGGEGESISETGGALKFTCITGGGVSSNTVTATEDQVNSIDLNTQDLTIFNRFRYQMGAEGAQNVKVSISVVDESANEVTIQDYNAHAFNSTDETVNFEITCDPTGNLINGVDVSSLTDGDEWHLRFKTFGNADSRGILTLYFVRWLDSTVDDVTFISSATASSETIDSAILVANKTINGTASAVYQLSADGGSNYETVTLNEIHRFSATGTSLMVKVTMTNDTDNEVYQLNQYAVFYNVI